MKDVLVTGGTGCIGSNLAAMLVERGCSVRLLRRERSDLRGISGIDVEHCIGDIRDAEAVRRAMRGCDTVFHTAAVVSFARRNARMQHDVNVLGTRTVVEACLAAGVTHLVHTSSVATIGHVPPGELATERTPFNWSLRSGYRVSKLKAEHEVMKGIERGLDAVIVNPSVVVGERDVYRHGGQIVLSVKKGRVPAYIDGGMSVVYVGDVVRAEIAAAGRGRRGERYIVSGENLTHKDIFTLTAKIVGGFRPLFKLPIPFLRGAAALMEKASNLAGVEPLISPDLVEGAGKYSWFDCTKAQRELGHRVTPFEVAVRSAFEWYRTHGFL